MTIHTSDDGSTERVRINSSGDVGWSGITVSPDGDIFTTGVVLQQVLLVILVVYNQEHKTGNATFLQNVNGDLYDC